MPIPVLSRPLAISPISTDFKSALLSCALATVAFAAEPVAGAPWASSAVNVETGVLWQIGRGTPIPYRLFPTQLSWRSAEFFGHAFADGSCLVLRHRLTLIATVVGNGPESRYLGFAGSPSLEWWNKIGTWSWFTGAGGGLGFTDARNIPGGLGQDLTLNWFMRGGIEHVTARQVHLTAGFMYQHLSNGGMTNPNPGIDALGFTLGAGWKF